jgi:hypothetical protein
MCFCELHQQSFHTNNHGKCVDRRINYVWFHLHELEPCFPVFVKLPLEEVEKVKREERLNQELQGHTCTRNGKEHRKFHVNCCSEFFDLLMSTPLNDRHPARNLALKTSGASHQVIMRCWSINMTTQRNAGEVPRASRQCGQKGKEETA